MLKTCTTFLSVFSLVVFLSGVAVAAPAPGCNDGTQAGGNSGGIWGIMENQAKAMRVRDEAFSEAIHTQPDSVLATPCFEQSLI